MKIRILLFILALCALAVALAGLDRGADGVSPQPLAIGAIPATLFPPPNGKPKAIVVIAHGFAGSQQMMAPLATTFARDGYLALTFDFAGHGRNRLPLHGGVVDLAASTRQLLGEIDEVLAFARARPEFHGRLALVGHSMASELVVQAAMRRDDIAATVALSLFGREVTTTSPKNLLIVDGAWEFALLRDAAKRIVSLTAPDPREGVAYGDFAKGTAREYVFARDAEHIGVIWSLDALTASRAWLDEAFGETATGAGVDRRGPWLAMLFLALATLMRLAIDAMPRLAEAPPHAPVAAKRFFALLAAASLMTPLLLWKAPTDFLPILLGDYLAAHFAVWGALLWAGQWWLGERRRYVLSPKAIAAAAALAALNLILLGWPLDLYVTSFWPTGVRWAIIAPEFAAIALAFTAEERLARGIGAPRFAYAAIKGGFVVSLIAAIALSPRRLFFLAIVAPVVAILFVGFGLLNHATFARTRVRCVAALGTALALAYAISVTFPIVD